jgi:hypothetical protein
MSSETQQTILALAETAKDATKPESERREALRLMANLRGEPDAGIDSIPIEDLGTVAALATTWNQVSAGLKDSSIRDSAETVADLRRVREHRAQQPPG